MGGPSHVEDSPSLSKGQELMALPNGFVGAPVSGGIYSGDTTATLPADAVAEIGAGLDKLG